MGVLTTEAAPEVKQSLRCSWGLAPATLLKKRLWHRCFPVNFEKILRKPFFIEHFWWLLLWQHFKNDSLCNISCTVAHTKSFEEDFLSFRWHYHCSRQWQSILTKSSQCPPIKSKLINTDLEHFNIKMYFKEEG